MEKYSSTKRANYRRDSHRSQRLWLVFFALIISVGLVFPWLMSTISAVVMYPFHATSVWVKTSDGMFPMYLREKADLVKEIESLRSKISTESGTQVTIKGLVEENMQLRSLAKAGVPEDRLVARVLSRPDQLSYDLLQIDKGSEEGVLEGAPVFTGLDSVIGVVVYVAKDYSFVDLFTSPGFESTAFIYGPNVFSPIEGIGGGVARVRLPQGVPIKEGQLVILPGVANGLYGEVVRVENMPTQPEQYGYITPLVAMNNLLFVSVGTKVIQNKSEKEMDAVIRDVIREAYKFGTSTTYKYTPEVEESDLDSTATDSEAVIE